MHNPPTSAKCTLKIGPPNRIMCRAEGGGGKKTEGVEPPNPEQIEHWTAPSLPRLPSSWYMIPGCRSLQTADCSGVECRLFHHTSDSDGPIPKLLYCRAGVEAAEADPTCADELRASCRSWRKSQNSNPHWNFLAHLLISKTFF